MMFCQKCGLDNSEKARYCSACGAELSENLKLPLGGNSTSTEEGARIADQYYEAAIGYKNTDFYLNRFNRFDSQGVGISWNWPAFFFSFYWLLYRKMWVWALLYFLMPIPLAIVEAILSPISEAAAGLVNVAYLVGIFVIFPMYANALYYQHAQRLIQKSKSLPDDKRQHMISSEGGTSSAALIVILILVFIAFIGILAAIAIPAYQDFTTRAKVSEGLSLGAAYKIKVSEYAIQNKRWPQSNADIDVSEHAASSNVASIAVVKDGVIVITFSGVPPLDGKSVALAPSVEGDNNIVWHCKGINIQNSYLPANCRQ